MLRSTTPVLTTDRQRLIAARQARPLPPPSGDKAKLGRVTHPRPVLPPLVVHDNTWVIRGKDGTYLGLSFGDGREVQQLNLYDHLLTCTTTCPPSACPG